MKKIGILTINDNSNYGNRLQNYALQKYIEKMGYRVDTIQNIDRCYSKNYIHNFLNNIKDYIKLLSPMKEHRRYLNFKKFNKNITFSHIKIDLFHIDKKINSNYDYFITGSDQVWNPTFKRLSKIDLLEFADDHKKISYAASFGISSLPSKYKKNTAKQLLKFKYISVREDSGKSIIEELNGRKDIEVLVDPTMLLKSEEWDKIARKSKKIKQKKYILNYFLGKLSDERKKEIERIAKENDCEIIDILDKKSCFYECGPSEFLWLEKNAFLICTDSFHSSVFAILYNRPFIIFEREQKGMSNMNSRLDTLISKFKLKNRKFEGKITEENIKHDYSEAYEILEIERQKSKEFLEKALDLKK